LPSPLPILTTPAVMLKLKLMLKQKLVLNHTLLKLKLTLKE
jgi:hypothetical protein